MNTGQTVYEQLQEILNKCIELGWNYKFLREYLYCTPTGLRNNDVHSEYYNELISYHELFSQDSGIMERFEWKEEKDHRGNKKEIAINPDIVGCVADVSYRQKNVEYHYMVMSHLTSEQKIQYFLENAIIPKP